MDAYCNSSVHRFDALQAAVSGTEDRQALFSTEEFRSPLYSWLDGLLVASESGPAVLSLDVFDTLVLRDRSSELTRFLEIGGRMAESLSSGTKRRPLRGVDAFVARHLATKASYRASQMVQGCREGSLVEIHDTASRMLTGQPDARETFINTELEYEAGRLHRCDMLLEYAKRHVAGGGIVVLTTDTYMHSVHVATLLERLDIDPHLFKTITSSADVKVSKQSGKVFALVEKRLDLPSSNFVHVGDCLKRDFQNPLLAGWQAVHLPVSDAERLARRKNHLETEKHLQREYSISVDIAMPL